MKPPRRCGPLPAARATLLRTGIATNPRETARMNPKVPSLTRRHFLRNTALTATALSYSRAAARAAGAEPSDTLRVAVAGWGAQALNALGPSLTRIPGVKIGAICDIHKFKTMAAQRSMDPRGITGLQTFTSYDEMLEKAG